LQLLRRFEEAWISIFSVARFDPNSQEALSNVIAMGIETDDLKRSRDHSMRLLDICPHSALALQGLATAAFGVWTTRPPLLTVIEFWNWLPTIWKHGTTCELLWTSPRSALLNRSSLFALEENHEPFARSSRIKPA
jgi:hypothetical protein